MDENKQNLTPDPSPDVTPTSDKSDGKKKSNDKKDHKRNRGKRGGSNPYKRSNLQDVDWYALSPEILRDAASLPFSNPIGSHVLSDVGNEGVFATSVSGICVLECLPTVGYSDSASSPLNLAALKFYSFVRQANSGSKNYEAPDLFMYFMAVSSLVELLAQGRRAYGLINRFSNYNKYLGQYLVEALGFDYSDIIANQANFRKEYNTIVDQINGALHVPKGLKYFERKAFVSSNVYADAVGNKFQLYATRPSHYFTYDATSFNTGTALKGVSHGGTPWTMAQYFSIIYSIIASLVSDEDIQIMSGDILKAYGDGGTLKMAPLDMDYQTSIIKDNVILCQIHNMQNDFQISNGQPVSFLTPAGIIVGQEGAMPTEMSEFTVPVVFQEGGIIKSYPVHDWRGNGAQSSDPQAQGTRNMLLDIPVDAPNPGDVMESTRLMACLDYDTLVYDAYQGPITTRQPITCATEIVLELKVYAFNKNSYISTTVYPTQYLTTAVDDSDSSYSQGVIATGVGLYTMKMAGYDWAPLFIGLHAKTTVSSRIAAIGDISQFTLLPRETLRNIHRAAMYGLFDVPTVKVAGSK